MRNGKLVFLQTRMSTDIDNCSSMDDWSRAIKKNSNGGEMTMFFIPADARLSGM